MRCMATAATAAMGCAPHAGFAAGLEALGKRDAHPCGQACATARATVVGAEGVEMSASLGAAMTRAACAACVSLLVCNEAEARDVSVCVRALVLFDAQSPSRSLQDYAPLPHTCARMIVKVPSTCVVDAEKGCVTAGLGDKVERFGLEEDFACVVGYTQCSMWMHAPRQGCGAFLVCDVVCCGVVAAPAVADNSRAEAMIDACVRCWASDTQCDKLAVVLDERWDAMRERGRFSFANLASQRDRAVVKTLMNCKHLDVAFAGKCACEPTCMYTYTPVNFACIYENYT